MLTRRECLALGAAAVASAREKRYKVVLVGHTGRGGFGHNWDLAWNGIPAVEVAAVADPDEAGRAKAMQRSGALRSYADYREMLRREKPDIVTIGVRQTDQHRALFLAAAEAGAHILIEKPFAGNLPDADAMVEAAERRKLKVQVGHPVRTAALGLKIREILRSGEIGTLLEMRSRGKEDKRAGGEDLIILGSHALDLMRWFAGDPQWVFAHVTDHGRELAHEHVRQGREAVGWLAGDQVAAMLSFAGGVHGYFGSMANDYLLGDRCGLALYCSRGAIFINLGTSRSGLSFLLRSPAWLPGRKQAVWEEISLPEPEIAGNVDRASAAMALDLLDAIEKNREPACNARDGRWTNEIISGVYQSQRSGRRVALPLSDRTDPLASL